MPEVSERMVKHFTRSFVESEFSRELLRMIFDLGEQDVGLRFFQILGMSSRAGAEENDNVVQGFAAIMEYSSEWAKKWVLAVESFYSNRSNTFTRSHSFDGACVLGLFVGANRRNNRVDKESEQVENFFPGALETIIFTRRDGVIETKSFEDLLSQQIKGYFRGTALRKDARLKSAMLLFKRVLARIEPEEKNRPPQTPSRFGWTILEQISYGVFGILQPKERLELLHDRYAPLILPKEEAKK